MEITRSPQLAPWCRKPDLISDVERLLKKKRLYANPGGGEGSGTGSEEATMPDPTPGHNRPIGSNATVAITIEVGGTGRGRGRGEGGGGGGSGRGRGEGGGGGGGGGDGGGGGGDGGRGGGDQQVPGAFVALIVQVASDILTRSFDSFGNHPYIKWILMSANLVAFSLICAGVLLPEGHSTRMMLKIGMVLTLGSFTLSIAVAMPAIFGWPIGIIGVLIGAYAILKS